MKAETWRDQAICAQIDPALFFPDRGGSTTEAQKICTGCDVRRDCRDYAVATGKRHGVWGGLTERELRVLIHQRADQAA